MIFVGFWMRTLATLIDLIVINVLVYGIGHLGAEALGVGMSAQEREALFASMRLGLAYTDQAALHQLAIYLLVLSLVSMVVVVVVDAILPATRLRSTPGKALLGVVMVDANGQPLGYGRAIGRHVAKSISALTFGIGFIMTAFTHEKQALHDMMLQTRVVKKHSLAGAVS